MEIQKNNKTKALSLGKIIPKNNIEHKTNNSLSKRNMIINNILSDIQSSTNKNPSELNKAKSIDKNNILPVHKKFFINQKKPKKVKVDSFMKDLGVNINYDDYLNSIKNNKRNIVFTIPNMQRLLPNKKLGPIINKKKNKH